VYVIFEGADYHVFVGIKVKASKSCLEWSKSSFFPVENVDYLHWDHCVICSVCDQPCKDGVLDSHNMIRRDKQNVVRVRCFPRVCHESCVKKIFEGINFQPVYVEQPNLEMSHDLATPEWAKVQELVGQKFRQENGIETRRGRVMI